MSRIDGIDKMLDKDSYGIMASSKEYRDIIKERERDKKEVTSNKLALFIAIVSALVQIFR